MGSVSVFSFLSVFCFFISELENSSEATKVQLNLKAELNKLSEELCNEARKHGIDPKQLMSGERACKLGFG